MYNDKLKSELLSKIKLLNDTTDKAIKRQQEWWDVEQNPDSTDEELRSIWEEKMEFGQCLWELEKEIDELLIDTKYVMLTGFNIADLKEVSYTKRKLSDELIEQNLDLQLLKVRSEMKDRINNVKPLFLHTHIDDRTAYIYSQAVRCYVYGMFEGCWVLCRAICESIAKTYIEKKGQGHLLVGADKNRKSMTLPQILKTMPSVPNETIVLYRKIGRRADAILHDRVSIAKNDDALEAINLVQSFIQIFPKTL